MGILSFEFVFIIEGLAAPAIAAGFGALAPALGTIIPVIGAGGFAAVATAAGSVAGSVAVAASFGGVRPFSSSINFDGLSKCFSPLN